MYKCCYHEFSVFNLRGSQIFCVWTQWLPVCDHHDKSNQNKFREKKWDPFSAHAESSKHTFILYSDLLIVISDVFHLFLIMAVLRTAERKSASLLKSVLSSVVVLLEGLARVHVDVETLIIGFHWMDEWVSSSEAECLRCAWLVYFQLENVCLEERS